MRRWWWRQHFIYVYLFIHSFILSSPFYQFCDVFLFRVVYIKYLHCSKRFETLYEINIWIWHGLWRIFDIIISVKYSVPCANRSMRRHCKRTPVWACEHALRIFIEKIVFIYHMVIYKWESIHCTLTHMYT